MEGGKKKEKTLEQKTMEKDEMEYTYEFQHISTYVLPHDNQKIL